MMLWVPGIARWGEWKVEAGPADGELMGAELAHDDRAGRAQTADACGIPRGDIIDKNFRVRRGRQTGDIDNVLDADGNTMQGPLTARRRVQPPPSSRHPAQLRRRGEQRRAASAVDVRSASTTPEPVRSVTMCDRRTLLRSPMLTANEGRSKPGSCTHGRPGFGHRVGWELHRLRMAKRLGRSRFDVIGEFRESLVKAGGLGEGSDGGIHGGLVRDCVRTKLAGNAVKEKGLVVSFKSAPPLSGRTDQPAGLISTRIRVRHTSPVQPPRSGGTEHFPDLGPLGYPEVNDVTAFQRKHRRGYGL